jgi:hypothetical protein
MATSVALRASITKRLMLARYLFSLAKDAGQRSPHKSSSIAAEHLNAEINRITMTVHLIDWPHRDVDALNLEVPYIVG